MKDGRRTNGAPQPRDLSQRAHRQLIGVLGLLLPVMLYAIAGLRPTTGLARWTLLPSVSAYYYTGAVAAFTGILFALSLFLLTYRGYEGVVADRVVGFVAGAAALGVAFFPTGAPNGLPGPSWWSPTLRVIHYASAIVLFTSFILFSIWLFRKSSIPERSQRPLDKRRRDTVFLVCGVVMIAAVLWAASAIVTRAQIFVPEAVAIIAFAISWLVKGEAHRSVVAAVRRLRGKPAARLRA